MAYDEGHAALLRDDLSGHDPEEKRMFGGLCFMLRGNMVCGVHKNGGLFRVGKPHMDRALALPGVGYMEMTGRRMGAFVDASAEAVEDDATRAALMQLALDFNASLPAK
jgi:hypothetical protein